MKAGGFGSATVQEQIGAALAAIISAVAPTASHGDGRNHRAKPFPQSPAATAERNCPKPAIPSPHNHQKRHDFGREVPGSIGGETRQAQGDHHEMGHAESGQGAEKAAQRGDLREAASAAAPALVGPEAQPDHYHERQDLADRGAGQHDAPDRPHRVFQIARQGPDGQVADIAEMPDDFAKRAAVQPPSGAFLQVEFHRSAQRQRQPK